MGRSSGEGGISQTLQVCGSCELLDLTLGQHKRRFCFPQKTSKQVIKKKKKKKANLPSVWKFIVPAKGLGRGRCWISDKNVI